MQSTSLKAAVLAFLPALALTACEAGGASQPPARIAVAAPEWTSRFDAWASKRRCRVTDLQTGETHRLRRYGGTEAISPQFTLDARRRRCDITENATGITCTFRGRGGRLTQCTAPNPLRNNPAAQTVSGNIPAMLAAAG